MQSLSKLLKASRRRPLRSCCNDAVSELNWTRSTQTVTLSCTLPTGLTSCSCTRTNLAHLSSQILICENKSAS